MVHTLPQDEDGDYPPSSIQHSLYAAQQWDAWKRRTYGETAKALSAVARFHLKDHSDVKEG
jgi:hypothetical protein